MYLCMYGHVHKNYMFVYIIMWVCVCWRVCVFVCHAHNMSFSKSKCFSNILCRRGLQQCLILCMHRTEREREAHTYTQTHRRTCIHVHADTIRHSYAYTCTPLRACRSFWPRATVRKTSNCYCCILYYSILTHTLIHTHK